MSWDREKNREKERMSWDKDKEKERMSFDRKIERENYDSFA